MEQIKKVRLRGDRITLTDKNSKNYVIIRTNAVEDRLAEMEAEHSSALQWMYNMKGAFFLSLGMIVAGLLVPTLIGGPGAIDFFYLVGIGISALGTISAIGTKVAECFIHRSICKFPEWEELQNIQCERIHSMSNVMTLTPKNKGSEVAETISLTSKVSSISQGEETIVLKPKAVDDKKSDPMVIAEMVLSPKASGQVKDIDSEKIVEIIPLTLKKEGVSTVKTPEIQVKMLQAMKDALMPKGPVMEETQKKMELKPKRINN